MPKNERRSSAARVRVGKMALPLALTIGLVLGATYSAAAEKKPSGYAAFARLSNSEKVLPVEQCKEYGGRPVPENERALVMGAGQTDKYFYNVLWFGQHQYVSYKRDSSKSITGAIGITKYTISLCQF